VNASLTFYHLENAIHFIYNIIGLMKNPVLQEKRQEHVTFQKYALELMELVAGKKKSNGAEIEASLANINRVCF